MDELLLVSFANYMLSLYQVNYPDGRGEPAEVSQNDLRNWHQAVMSKICIGRPLVKIAYNVPEDQP
jgi:hypothetical protein